MIEIIANRDMFQEYAPNRHGAGNIMILASEEYINKHFNLSPNDQEPVAFQNEQLGHVKKLFGQIRNDKDFKDHYRTIEAKNNLYIILLATTEEGYRNAQNYLQKEILEYME
jgi:hypothetical protein